METFHDERYRRIYLALRTLEDGSRNGPPTWFAALDEDRDAAAIVASFTEARPLLESPASGIRRRAGRISTASWRF